MTRHRLAAVLVGLGLCMMARSARAAESNRARQEPLRGLHACQLIIAQSSGAPPNEIKEQIVQRLKKAGIEVAGSGRDVRTLPGHASIAIVIEPDIVRLHVAEEMTLSRDHALHVYGDTWSTACLTSGNDVRTTIENCLTQFLNDYAAANQTVNLRKR